MGYKNQVVLQMTFKPAYLILFLCIFYIIIGYLSEDYLLAGGGAIGLFILKFWWKKNDGSKKSTRKLELESNIQELSYG